MTGSSTLAGNIFVAGGMGKLSSNTSSLRWQISNKFQPNLTILIDNIFKLIAMSDIIPSSLALRMILNPRCRDGCNESCNLARAFSNSSFPELHEQRNFVLEGNSAFSFLLSLILSFFKIRTNFLELFSST